MSENVATLESEPTGSADGPRSSGGGSLWADAWRQLRRSPVFWLSVAIVMVA